jgi:NAD(P)-dependent dehydrogenase (short-subunit alcohol dehydrogenase family)
METTSLQAGSASYPTFFCAGEIVMGESMSSCEFKDKFGVVTAAAKGIGLATAKLPTADEAGISLVDIDQKEIKRAEEAISGSGALALSVQANVAKKIDVERVIRESLKANG